MNDKKVVFLSPSAQEYNIGLGNFGSEEYRMNRIADIIEKRLINDGYVVYRNNPNETLKQIVQQSNKINPDIHVALHSNASGTNIKGQGPEIYANRKIHLEIDLLMIYMNRLYKYILIQKRSGVFYIQNRYMK